MTQLHVLNFRILNYNSIKKIAFLLLFPVPLSEFYSFLLITHLSSIPFSSVVIFSYLKRTYFMLWAQTRRTSLPLEPETRV